MSLLSNLQAFNTHQRATSKCSLCGLPQKAGVTSSPILARATRIKYGLCVCSSPENDPSLEALEMSVVKSARLENAKLDEKESNR